MEHTLEIPGSTVHYWVHNPEKKPTIVMIHGFTGDHFGFQKIIPYLTNYRLVIPDLPGSGVSTISPEHWGIDKLAALTNTFVRALKLPKPPIIFGHSMGGLVVASMVHQAPDLYSKVVLLSPVPSKIGLDSRWLGAKLGELQYLVGYTVPYIGPKIVKSRWLTDKIATMLITTKDPEIIAFTRQQMQNNLKYISSMKYYFVLERSINKRGAIDYATELAKKDLFIINGDSDRVVPLKYLEPLVRQTNANFVLIPGVGHDAHYERAAEVASAVNAFLTRPAA